MFHPQISNDTCINYKIRFELITIEKGVFFHFKNNKHACTCVLTYNPILNDKKLLGINCICILNL